MVNNVKNTGSEDQSLGHSLENGLAKMKDPKLLEADSDDDPNAERRRNERTITSRKVTDARYEKWLKSQRLIGETRKSLPVRTSGQDRRRQSHSSDQPSTLSPDVDSPDIQPEG